MKKLSRIIFLLPALIIASDDLDNLRKRIPIQTEEQVNIKLNFGAGNLYFGTSESNLLFDGEFIYSDVEPLIKYHTHGNEGDLIINMEDDIDKDNFINISISFLDCNIIL